ncbi:MAG: RDD family protein [Candidatus Sulfotelmatobacter sp.]
MPCSLCGDICRCSSEEACTSSPRWVAEPDAGFHAELPTTPESQEVCERASSVAAEVALAESETPPEDSSAWRQELAARLNRYHSRRKPRPPRYPSLRLRFEGNNPDAVRQVAAESSVFPQVIVSSQALALDEFTPSATAVDALGANLAATATAEAAPERGSAQVTPAVAAPITAPVTAKIIEFPRSWTPPPVPLDQLAEPVITRPRILEAPALVPPPPALGGITIEPAQQPELEKRPGIDVPLQSAPLGRRIFSAVVDDLIIATACTLFGYIFWKLTASHPQGLEMVAVLAGLAGAFWAGYQYLLMVYAGTTPGLRLARLELTRFNGSPAGRSLRRWRVLASYLSAISLGMGYVWVFLDEDSLCWHDRITHTYLAPKSCVVDPKLRTTQR